MVEGRRFRVAILVVPFDEVLPDCIDSSGIADLVGHVSHKVVTVCRPCDLVNILLGTVEENQNGREPVYGTQNCPILLAESGKVTDNDVLWLSRRLWDRATPALEFSDNVAWNLREG